MNMISNSVARQASPEIKGRDATKTENSQKAQALPTFDLQKMSSRNNGATKSTGSTKEHHASPFHQSTPQHNSIQAKKEHSTPKQR